MAVLYLNGDRLKNSVVMAAQRVLERQERLNGINVFPVADADTGTNMALTLKSVAEVALNARRIGLSDISSQMAEAALMGSQGNSGAILAQFFQGMAEGFSGEKRIDLRHFADAMVHAVHRAEQAISEPVEGTILTVMRDWARDLHQTWSDAPGFVELFRSSLATARTSLDNTPQQLKALAKANVVDAGAQGFVNMLEGILDYADSGAFAWSPPSQSDPVPVAVIHDPASITFRYCTECLIEGKDLDSNQIRQSVEEMGDSLIVAGTSEKIRIHIHTDEPDRVFAYAAQCGDLSRTKADDMRQQHNDYHGPGEGPEIAILADSSCDLSDEFIRKHRVRLVPVSVTFGSKTYLDRINITSDEVYRLMEESPHHPTTSQPAPGIFLRAMEMAAETNRAAVVVTMSSAVSGTYQSCLTAVRRQDKIPIEVIDSRSTAGAMGLLIGVAAEAIAEGYALEEVKQRVLAARPHARIFVTVKTLKYLVRGGRVGKLRGFLGKILDLVPILTFSEEGRAVKIGQAKSGLPSWRKLIDTVEKASKRYVNLRFSICHANDPEAAQFLEKELKERFGLDHVDVLPVSPTLSAQIGPGASGISMLGDPIDRTSNSTA